MIEKVDIKYMQNQPLNIKINMAEQRIVEWYEYFNGDVYISFSGGKDSRVMLDIVRRIYPNVPAVFANTGLEFPEIVSFTKTIKNVEVVYPKIPFQKVIKTYGYPVISKEQAQKIREVQGGTTQHMNDYYRNGVMKGGYKSGAVSKKWQYLMDQHKVLISEKCCDIMKKKPFHLYEKKTGFKPFVGTMAGESRLRSQSIGIHGCNAFGMKKPQSRPLSFWNEADIWEYIKINNLSYSKIYDMGYKRTGCMFCMFGVHLEEYPNRFQKMEITHPKQYKYCIEKLGIGRVLDFIGVRYTNEIKDNRIAIQQQLF